MHLRVFKLSVVVALAIISATNGVFAQTLEPRAYSNAPVGMNFLLVGYQASKGGLLFDPAVPITDAKAEVDIGLLAYVRTLDVAGNSAKAGVILPYANLHADGFLNGDFRTRDTKGIADPAFYFCATSLQTGSTVSISPACLFDPQVGWLEKPDLPLAKVLQASTACPPVFAPVVLNLPAASWEYRESQWQGTADS